MADLYDDLGYNPWFSMGAGILSESGRGVPTGQAVGRGILSGMQNMRRQEQVRQQADAARGLANWREFQMEQARAKAEREQAAADLAAQQREQFAAANPEYASLIQGGYGEQVAQALTRKPQALPQLQQNINWAMSLPDTDPRKQVAVQAITRPMFPPPTAPQGYQYKPSPETGELTLEKVPGYTSPKKSDQINAINTLLDSLEHYDALLGQYGTELWGEGSTRLENAHTALMMDIKTADELGALQGADLGLLYKQLSDPTTPKAALTPTARFRAQADETKKRFLRRLKRMGGERTPLGGNGNGGPPRRGGQGQTPPPPPGFTEPLD